MKFTKTTIPDVILIEPLVHGDTRGYFLETFRQDFFENMIQRKISFVQDNESKSSRGVVRGLHFQVPPYSQAKLVRVVEGVVLDVAVDLRKDSKTYGQHVSAILSDENKAQLFIPEGFAHGFVSLSEESIFAYKTTNYFSPEHEKGIVCDDDDLDIDWSIGKEFMQYSERDRNLPSFKEFNSPFRVS